MKIENSGKPTQPTTGGIAPRARAPQGNSAAAPQGNAATPSSTEATLSGLQGMGSVLATSAVIDVERVAEIKQAIAEGRFQVNAERIADGLLQSVHEMLSSSR